MRRIFELSMLCLAAGVVSACKPDEVLSSPAVPTAGVRFINAVPDTAGAGGLDFRFVDIVDNNNALFGITFRNSPQTSGGVTSSTSIQYKPAQAGARHFRIFLDDTLQTIASTVLKDSTASLEAGHNYTFLLWGNARSSGSDKMRLSVIDENIADPGSQVALRVINTTGSAIDVRTYPSSGTVPSSPTWANVAAYSISTFVNAAPSQIRYNVQPAGGGTALFSDALAIPGQGVGAVVGGCTVGVDCDVTPGTTVAGSAVTLIVFPKSASGRGIPSFSSVGGTFMWDRRPKQSCTASFGC